MKVRGVCIKLGVLPQFIWRPRGLSKSVISRVRIRVTPSRVLITLLITYLLSPLGLQVALNPKPYTLNPSPKAVQPGPLSLQVIASHVGFEARTLGQRSRVPSPQVST